MNTRKSTAIGAMALVGLAFAPQAMAKSSQPADESASQPASQSIRVEAETQDYSGDLGLLRSVRIEYKYDDGDTTVLFSPVVGERRVAGGSSTAFGAGGTVYHNWSDTISTRTETFIAEDKSVFANLEFGQEVTFKVAPSTTVTLGGRWARYSGGQDVVFFSLGARRYFRGGSVAYRLTRVAPTGLDASWGHLINLTINDSHGAGKTQLWLSTGANELARSQLAGDFSGQDYSGMLKRTQPLTDKLSLIAGAGFSSYDRPGRRVSATNFELGLQLGIDRPGASLGSVGKSSPSALIAKQEVWQCPLCCRKRTVRFW